jgi:beta-glucanase (GH16 family)
MSVPGVGKLGRGTALGLVLAAVGGSVGCGDDALETAPEGSSAAAGAGVMGTGGVAEVNAGGARTSGGGAGTGGAAGDNGGSPSGGAGTGGVEAATGGVGGATGGSAGTGGAAVTGGSTGTTGGGTATGGDDTGGSGGEGTGGSGPAGSGGDGTGGSGPAGSGGAETGGSDASGGAPAGGSGGLSGGGGAGTYYLSDLCELGDADNAWGPVEKDLSNGEEAEGDGGPLTIAAEVYSKGLGAHAPSDIGYALNGNCSTFYAMVGVDDEMRDAGSVVFEVWGDGAQLYQSSVITGAGGATSVEVDVSGVAQLRLVVSDDGGNGSDHADWAEARVDCSAQPTDTCERQEAEIVVPAGYHLVWSDEFDVEGRPNSANWGYESGFVRNEEAQWYQKDNAWVQAGFLIIEGRREQVANPDYSAGSSDWKTNRQYAEYTSSSLRTMGLQTWQYGRFEMRARIVAQGGLWPAWWTLGESGEWPSCGEIDIMEYYNGRVHANVACGTNERWVARWDSASREVSSFGANDWDAKFHVWRMDWDDQTISLFLDDEQLNTTNLDDMLNPGGDSPFRQPHYMLINLAIGGSAGGDPSSATFPTHYEVDYVRVFQR